MRNQRWLSGKTAPTGPYGHRVVRVDSEDAPQPCAVDAAHGTATFIGVWWEERGLRRSGVHRCETVVCEACARQWAGRNGVTVPREVLP